MKYRLEDLFELQMGKTPSRSNNMYWTGHQNKWISIADLSRADKYIECTKEFISDTAIRESGIKPIPPNTVVMSFKLSIGKVSITSDVMYSNEAIMAFVDKQKIKISPDYLYYLFKHKTWDEGTNKAVLGKTLNKVTLSNIEVDIHQECEQQHIVKVLDKAYENIQIREKQLKELDDLIKSQFVEMFGDPVQNNIGWLVRSCEAIAKKIGSGATPKGGREGYQKEGISLIRSMNIHNNRFEYKDLVYIDDDQADKLANVEVGKEDVLLNITGASVARCCVVPEEVLPARVNQHVSIVRCKEEVIPQFLCHQFINRSYQRKLWDIATSGGATREALTKQQLRKLQIIIPPTELQNQFADLVHQIDKSKFVVQKSLDEAQLLFDSLMQKYFG